MLCEMDDTTVSNREEKRSDDYRLRYSLWYNVRFRCYLRIFNVIKAQIHFEHILCTQKYTNTFYNAKWTRSKFSLKLFTPIPQFIGIVVLLCS